jgi:putative RNA 2'-phosphotransferase
MNRQRTLKRLAKLLITALDRIPHEYGLVPDKDGFVSIKELIKALHETEATQRIRRGDIDELILSLPDSGVEMLGNRIRASGAHPPPVSVPAASLPKCLFTCIRRKAHLAVSRKGIRRSGDAPPVLLTPDRDAAQRLGRRRDADPVVVTVNTRMATEAGAVFFCAGEGLYTAESLPVEGLSLPPLPKDRPQDNRSAPPDAKLPSTSAGSYIVDPSTWNGNGGLARKPAKRRRDPEWKRSRRGSKRR